MNGGGHGTACVGNGADNCDVVSLAVTGVHHHIIEAGSMPSSWCGRDDAISVAVMVND